MERRTSTLLTGLLTAALAVAGCGGDDHVTTGKAVVVIGIDGLDWGFAQKLIAEGRMPNLSRLAAEGTSRPLGTAVPPLSPIAWSDFTTGLDSGGHGIFDFLHRDPARMIPESSLARVENAPPMFTFGKYQIPGAGSTELLRKGEEFWAALEARGVETWIYRMPVNFPPSGRATREISGMGTPDLTGSLGEFSFYTTALFFDQVSSGGEVYPLDLWEDRAEGAIYGPPNTFLVDEPKLEAPLTVYFDPEEDVAEVVVGDERVVMAVGDWSDWVPVTFEMPALQTLTGTVRFYLRSVRPEVELYATPLQIDPMEPALPVSTPEDYATELAEATGRFYTQGMPEDTKAYTEEVFSRDEFLAQAEIAHRELVEQLEHVLPQFRDGLFFYYFGNLDQVSHLMWGAMDPEHPAYDPAVDPQYADVVPGLYEEADRIVGYVMATMPEDALLVVMSDHGFASWRRTMNLNSWLRDEGYLVVKNPNLAKDPGLFLNVDWSKTRAYGVGFNGLYVNVRGREREGIVPVTEIDGLLDEIGAKLLAAIDPQTGGPVVTKVYPSARFFHDRGGLEAGPDMVVGYAKGSKGSSEGALGELTPSVFSDNTGRWTGDHSMDHESVPGILFTNRPLAGDPTSLRELAPSLMAEFGVEGFPARAQSD